MSKKVRRTPEELDREAEQRLDDAVDKKKTEPKPLRVTIGDMLKAKKGKAK